MTISLDARRQDGVVIVSAAGELDAQTAPELAERFAEILSSGDRYRGLLVDFTEVTFCDSRGVAALISGYRKAKERGVTMALANPQRPVYRLFVIAGIDQVLKIYDDLSAALADLAKDPVSDN